MVQPGVYNITLQRRADYSISLRFLDSNKQAINLTGWTVHAQIWNVARTSKYADFAVTYTNRSEGRVQLSLTYSQTTDLPTESAYDVLLINSAGVREYYMEGAVNAQQSYTTP